MDIWYDRKIWMSDVYDSIVFFDVAKPVVSTADDRDCRILVGTDAYHFTFGTIQECLCTKDMR